MARWILPAALLLVPYTLALYYIATSHWLSASNVNNADTTKAILAFLATGVTAAITMIGLLLTAEHNRSTRNQLALDTAVKSLGLIEGDQAESKALVGGAIASLVHLGHPIIAIRVLDSAWESNAVHSASACWLIGEVLERDHDRAAIEAAALLRSNVDKLACHLNEPCEYYWPPTLYRGWRYRLPWRARVDLVMTAVELILCRPRAWWAKGELIWILLLLNSIQDKERDRDLCFSAAAVALLVCDFFDAQDVYRDLDGKSDITISAIREKAQSFNHGKVIGDVENRREDLEKWLTGKPLATTVGSSARRKTAAIIRATADKLWPGE